MKESCIRRAYEHTQGLLSQSSIQGSLSLFAANFETQPRKKAMGLILQVIKLAAGPTINLIRSVVAKACLPRIPPSNWDTSHTTLYPVCTAHAIRVKGESEDNSGSLFRVQDEGGHLDLEHLLDSDWSVDSVRVESGESEGDLTLCSMDDSHMVDFSIYSDASSPNLNKAMLITPASPSLFDMKDADCALLVEASERISEILRENRRRLDAGEDPCISRREARRKRAQELSTVRKARQTLTW